MVVPEVRPSRAPVFLCPRLVQRGVLRRRALAAEAVVVAGGGVVAGDDALPVQHEQAEVVDAAAHTEAVLLLAVAPAGLIVGDFGSDDNHRARAYIDAA